MSKIFIYAFFLLSFVSCMPDNLTKFEEDTQNIPQSSGAAIPPSTAPESFSYEKEEYSFIINAPIVELELKVEGNEETGPHGSGTTYEASELPDGLSISSTTGEISGTPTAFYTPKDIVITATNLSGSTITTIKVGVFNPPEGLRVTPRPNINITVASTTGFVVSGGITQGSGPGYSAVGTIVQKSGDILTVNVTSGTFRSTLNVTSSNSTTTSISELTYSNQVQLYVESVSPFSLGQVVSTSDGLNSGIVSQIGSNSVVLDLVSGGFAIGDTLSSTTVTKVNYIYLDNDSIDLSPVLPQGENISYSTTQELGKEYLPVDKKLGKIIGVKKGSGEEVISLQAKNEVGEITSTFSVGPIISVPSYLNYSQELLVHVKDNSSFARGDYISSEVKGSKAEVIKVIDGTKAMIIRPLTEGFSVDRAIDTSVPFGGEKTTITKIDNYTETIIVANGSASSYEEGDFISGYHTDPTQEPRGIIVFVDPNGSGPDHIYIKSISGDFEVGANISNTKTYSGPGITPLAIEGKYLTLELASASSFSVGMDVTDTNGSSGSIIDKDSDNITVEVFKQGFNTTNGVDNTNPFAAAETTISSIKREKTIQLYTGESAFIRSSLLQGSDVSYFIIPDLPEGLSIDEDNGNIVGTPTKKAALKSYQITAQNVLNGTVNKATYNFNLEVHAHITFGHQTKGSYSYIVHQEGRGNELRNCRITEKHANSPDHANKEVVCRVEAEELDLFKNGLQATIKSSPGMCQFIRTTPYAFYNWQYIRTNNPTYTVVTDDGCTGGPGSDKTLPDGLKYCIGDYSDIDGPNCDDGEYTIYTRAYSGGAGVACDLTPSTTTIKCGGKPSNCIGGAIKDIYDASAIEAGIRSTIYNSNEGVSIEDWKFKAPIEKSTGNNIRLANYTANNSCASITNNVNDKAYNYSARNWEKYKSTHLEPLLDSALSPTGAGTAAANLLTGTNTDFTTDLLEGDEIVVNQTTFTVDTILTATTLRVSPNFPETFSGEIIYKKVTGVSQVLLPGTVDITEGSTTVTGTNTDFDEVLSIGSVIYIDNFPNIVTAINSDTNITVRYPFYEDSSTTNIYKSTYSDPFKGNSLSPFYVVECLDAASDPIAKIRIQVRDWDVAFKAEHQIDELSKKIDGTVVSSSGSNTYGITGSSTSFESVSLGVDYYSSTGSLASSRMIELGDNVSTVSSTTSDTVLVLDERFTNLEIVSGSLAYVRPPLMDAGTAVDLFNDPLNDRSDWDDKRGGARHPSLVGCQGDSPVPSIIQGGNEGLYRFTNTVED